MTDAEALKRLRAAGDAVNRAVNAHGVWCDCHGCQTVYRRWTARHQEVERRGLAWKGRL